MALSINPKVSLPARVGQTPPAPRALQKQVGDPSQNTQQAAQSFLQQLPPDIRERVGNAPNRENFRRNRFDETQAATQDTRVDQVAAKEQEQTDTRFQIDVEANPVYSAPIIPANLVLLQEQRQPDTRQGPLPAAQYDSYHTAYLSAGAQPGGEAAAFEASIRQQEQAQKTLIVPPVPTSINFSA